MRRGEKALGFAFTGALIAWVLVNLCSCEWNTYSASNGVNTVTEKNYQLGGTRSSRRADGSSVVNDYQQSARDLSTAFVGLFGAYFTADVQKAKEVTAQLAASGATKVQISQIQAAAALAAAKAKAQAGVTSQAIQSGAPVNPITVNPP